MAMLCMIAIGLPFCARAGLATVSEVPERPPPPLDTFVESAPDTAIPAAVGNGPPEVAAPPDLATESLAPPRAPNPCSDALAWVAAAGLPLPAGVGFHCPSTQFTHQGAACWHGAPCPKSGFVAINIDRLSGTSIEYLHHVVAHEVCHILEFQATGWSTEASADACAAAHGAPA
ncbi:MAG TPA: hypothetical protein VMZ73_03440 [Acidimicrobiales bacterium]|nr:hypothetical protein [Acidimicrobiales bacterium]